MIIVEFPKFDINNIKILVTEEFPIFVDLWFVFNIEQTLQNVGLLELPILA